MRSCHLLLITSIAIMVASCSTVDTVEPTKTPVTTPGVAPAVTASVTPEIPAKQPEPDQPLIKGLISGLPDGVLVFLYIKTPSGRVRSHGTSPGNGTWEAVLANSSGEEYVVTAEAEGFTSNPISHTIQISGETAYVVEKGRTTTQEALHLDFHFTPASEPHQP